MSYVHIKWRYVLLISEVVHEFLLCTSVRFIGQPIIHSSKLLIWLYYLWCYNVVSSVGTKCKKISKIEVGDFLTEMGFYGHITSFRKYGRNQGSDCYYP